ncbi:MAG: hypothetical protein HQL82_02955 [Magnetococcales bacterium]|nr:hypothetical protein [Magnetococcales bacterium]
MTEAAVQKTVAMGDVINLAILSYGLLIVIALLAALLIKGIVVSLSSAAPAKSIPAPASKPQPVAQPDGVPAHHVAIIAAAVHMLHRRVRIVRIHGPSADVSWTSVGRSILQSSHNVRR